jgi:hypothetical protein
MRLIRNFLDGDEVEKIIENMVPSCEHAKRYALHDNDRLKNITEVPEWKDKINRDSLMELYNKEEPLDLNNTKNLFNYSIDKVGGLERAENIRRVLRDKYGLKVQPRGQFYYPPTGYMGWHTNCGAPGERFYITWASEDKKSFFRYYDCEKDEIITDYDDKGLTVRRFKVTETEPYFWHCVGSECDRFSLGFLVQSSVALDFDIYQTLIDKMEHKDISDYVSKLVLDANNK